MAIFISLIFLTFALPLLPEVRSQHLMQLPPQRVIVGNFAPGIFHNPAPPPAAPSAPPQFRIVQTFNGPFRILTNSQENPDDIRPQSTRSSTGNSAFPAPQSIATHQSQQFISAPQNQFVQPVGANFNRPSPHRPQNTHPGPQFSEGPISQSFIPFHSSGFHNGNQNVHGFQQQEQHFQPHPPAPNGHPPVFFTNPFLSTTQTHFPFHASSPTLPPRFTMPGSTSGNPPGETSTSPTTFPAPFQQNFEAEPSRFGSENPSAGHFHPQQSQFPIGPPRFDTTTSTAFFPGSAPGQHFRPHFQHGPSPGPQSHERQTEFPPFQPPQTSTEFQDPFSTGRPEHFLPTFSTSQENGFPESRERFQDHGSNFPQSAEFPRAPISFFGQGFQGISSPHQQLPQFPGQQFSTGSGSSSEFPPPQSGNQAQNNRRPLPLNNPALFHTQNNRPSSELGNFPQIQFTSEELRPEITRPQTPELPKLAPTAPPTPQSQEQFRRPTDPPQTLSQEDIPTTSLSAEAFPDIDSSSQVPEFPEQHGVRIEPPNHGPATHLTPSLPDSTERELENLKTTLPTRKPQSPSFVAILNNLQKPPPGEDQLQRPQPTRGSTRHPTATSRRTTRVRRPRPTTPRVRAQTVEPLQDLATEPPIAHRVVVDDILQSGSSSPPVVGSDAKTCNPSACQLPNCFCGGNQQIPGGLKVTEVPQMILLTFDDSVNEINYGFYSSLLNDGRINPNGCPISATFYVSHEWTDYAKIQTLYSLGHEIASHSISHSDGAPFTKERWDQEINGQRRILSALGKVRIEDIKGMRAPFLQGGGNKQFAMLYETNFTYDSSIPANLNNPPIWPYTLDYRMPHECGIPPCPNKAFPGVWEVPMVMWEDLNGGRCAMADACHNPADARGVYDMLVKNFKRHYTSNRAPFGMFYHYAWFTHPHQREGFLAFMDALLKLPDVYFVTNSQMLDWVRNPVAVSQIKNFRPWQCHSSPAESCLKPKRCTYRFKGDERNFPTCQPCPEKYPWLESYKTLHVTM